MNQIKAYISKNNLAILIGIALLLRGGYFYYETCIIGLILLGYVIYGLKYKQWQMPLNSIMFGLMSWLVINGVTVFWAVDPGMASLGMIRWVTLLLFYIVAYHTLTDETALKLQMIKGMTVFSAVGIILAMIPFSQSLVMANGRYQTLFQYANTGGLISMLGVLIAASMDDKKSERWYSMAILATHTFLTASRGVLVIGGIYLVLMLLIQRRLAIKQLIAMLAGVLSGYVITLILDIGSTKRLGEITVGASEFQNRLLYYKDALFLLSKKWWGLGHLGYYYEIGSVQTGYNYMVKYPHSFPLEVLLDVGVIGFLILGFFVCISLYKRIGAIEFKLWGLFLLTHSLIDFDFQFTVLWMLLLLLLHQFSTGGTYQVKAIYMKIPMAIVSVFMIYTLLVTIAQYTGYSTIAHKLYGGYSEAITDIAGETLDTGDYPFSEVDENKKQNKYNWKIFEIDYAYQMSQQAYEKAEADAERLIAIRPLSGENYNRMIYALWYQIEFSKVTQAEKLRILEKIVKIPYDIDSVMEKRASKLRIIHGLELDLSQECLDIITKANQLLAANP